ncbi:MAG: polyphosphate kinase 1 [Candidatus Dormibacteria bacterium]
MALGSQRVETKSAARRRKRAPGRKSADTRYINRELSWLDFNVRVLALAEDAAKPLLERAKFLAIVSSNLDEFFQVRVAGLKEQVVAGVTTRSPDGMTATAQLAAIRKRVAKLITHMEAAFTGDVAPGLSAAGVRIVRISDLSSGDRSWLKDLFERHIFPVLTPLAVDPAHPFPYISNLSLNLAVLVRDTERKTTRFARVKVPPVLPRFVTMPDGQRFVPLEQVIAAHLGALFPGMKVLEHHPFRVTRNADLDVEEDEADDLLDAIESELRRHRRDADVVRLEVDPGMSEEILTLLTRELELSQDDVYKVDGLLDLTGLWSLVALERPDLKDELWLGTTASAFTPRADGDRPDFFGVISRRDVLVHHPYESFATSVEAFIEQASRDPSVLAIKQTLYRTSGPERGIIRSLIRAAETGKQVVALVELKARFDEQANIVWARALEQAGVHVVYGLVGLKTHAKTSLIVRQEKGEIRRYCHLATGNYNPKTATIYEDVGIFTSDEDIGEDVTELFNYLTGYSRQSTWRRLLVAPVGLRDNILALIKRETEAKDGSILMKMNSLVDEQVIDALYTASQSGTSVTLVTRSICCLRPGVEGQSETIHVRSLVGRFLEHSRIFRFGSASRGYDYYIGSADMMPRNLDRRIEVLVPVLDKELKQRLEEILQADLDDDVLAWDLGAKGWRKVPTRRDIDAHKLLQGLAIERAHPTLRVARD